MHSGICSVNNDGVMINDSHHAILGQLFDICQYELIFQNLLNGLLREPVACDTIGGGILPDLQNMQYLSAKQLALLALHAHEHGFGLLYMLQP